MHVSGFQRRAQNTLQLVVTRYPSELNVWNDLGVQALRAGQSEAARKAFSEVRILYFVFLFIFHSDCWSYSAASICFLAS